MSKTTQERKGSFPNRYTTTTFGATFTHCALTRGQCENNAAQKPSDPPVMREKPCKECEEVNHALLF